jgi:hypothetical protein
MVGSVALAGALGPARLAGTIGLAVACVSSCVSRDPRVASHML